jgi:hypothetical protein
MLLTLTATALFLHIVSLPQVTLTLVAQGHMRPGHEIAYPRMGKPEEYKRYNKRNGYTSTSKNGTKNSALSDVSFYYCSLVG